jgi:uncharacterized protein YggT (Ycf19 family)
MFIVIADAILSWFPQYRHESWALKIKQLAGYTLNPIRRVLPSDLPVDLSPIIVIIIIQLIPSLW